MRKPMFLQAELMKRLVAVLKSGADLDTVRQELLNRIVDEVQCRGSECALHADACSIYLIDAHKRNQANMVSGSGYHKQFVGQHACAVVPAEKVPEFPVGTQRLGLTGWVISTERAFLAGSYHELSSHPHWRGKYPSQPKDISSFLAVPLRDPSGRVIGAMKAERTLIRDQFSASDEIALETLALIAGRCVYYTGVAKKFGDRALTAWARDVIAEAAAAEGEIDSFLEVAANFSATAIGADSGAVFLIDEGKRTLTQRAGCGSQAPESVVRSYKIPTVDVIDVCPCNAPCNPDNCIVKPNLGRDDRIGLTCWVVVTGKSFRASSYNDISRHCHHRGQYDTPEKLACGAWMGVPLGIGRPIGMLKVENDCKEEGGDGRVFSNEDMRRLETLAHDITISIERVRMQVQTHLAVIDEASKAIRKMISGQLSFKSLIQLVANSTMECLDARACSLFLKDGDDLVQPPWAASGYATNPADKDARDVTRRYRLVSPSEIAAAPASEDDKVGLTVWIAVKQEPYSANSFVELKLHPHHKGRYDKANFESDQRCESFMGTPLLFRQENPPELLGVLKVETKVRGKEYSPFTDTDSSTFQLIADCASIAIKNMRLLETKRLAEDVLRQPNEDGVMQCLRDSVEELVIVDTLRETAVIVSQKNVVRGQMIQTFANLLNPDADVSNVASNLEALASYVRGFPSGELIDVIVDGLRVDGGESLVKHLPTGIPASALNAAFHLWPLVELLQEVRTEVSGRLQAGSRLKDQIRLARDYLRDRLGQLSPNQAGNAFDQAVFRAVLTQWSDVLNRMVVGIRNPYHSGTALPPETSVFYGRYEIFDWLESNFCTDGRKEGLVLHSRFHCGKSSLLLQLEQGERGRYIRNRKERPLYPIFFRMQDSLALSETTMLQDFTTKIAARLRERGIVVDPPTAMGDDPFAAFNRFLANVGKKLRPTNGLVVMLIDEYNILAEYVERGTMDRRIFEYIRSLIQFDQPITFILAGKTQLMAKAGDQTWSEINNVSSHLELRFLSEEETRQLIEEPLKKYGVTYELAAVKKIIAFTACHPLLVQQVCHDCVDEVNHEKHFSATCAVVDKAIARSAVSPVTSSEFKVRMIDTMSDQQKQVLEVAAGLFDGGMETITESEIAERIGSQMARPEIEQVLDELVDRYLLKLASTGEDRLYSRNMELFWRWRNEQVRRQSRA